MLNFPIVPLPSQTPKKPQQNKTNKQTNKNGLAWLLFALAFARSKGWRPFFMSYLNLFIAPASSNRESIFLEALTPRGFSCCRKPLPLCAKVEWRCQLPSSCNCSLCTHLQIRADMSSSSGDKDQVPWFICYRSKLSTLHGFSWIAQPYVSFVRSFLSSHWSQPKPEYMFAFQILPAFALSTLHLPTQSLT